MFLVFSPFYFQDFGSSLLSLLWIFFQIACLFPLNLFGLLGFLPCSFACSVFLFCFILSNLQNGLCYGVYGLLFIGYRILVPLVSVDCPLLGEFVPGTCVSFLVEDLWPALCWVELSLFPLMGRAASGDVFWGICELNTTLGSLSTDGWGCVPVLLVVWCEVFSTGACRQLWRARSWCWYGYLQECTCQLVFPWPGNSPEFQSPGMYVSTPEAQARPLVREPRACKPYSAVW